jgi:hypothetical protein
MTSAALAGLLLRQPFQPFSFVLAGNDGEVRVNHPSEVHHQPGDRIVTVIDPDLREYIIDLDRVALITVERRKPKPWPDERGRG